MENLRPVDVVTVNRLSGLLTETSTHFRRIITAALIGPLRRHHYGPCTCDGHITFPVAVNGAKMTKFDWRVFSVLLFYGAVTFRLMSFEWMQLYSAANEPIENLNHLTLSIVCITWKRDIITRGKKTSFEISKQTSWIEWLHSKDTRVRWDNNHRARLRRPFSRLHQLYTHSAVYRNYHVSVAALLPVETLAQISLLPHCQKTCNSGCRAIRRLFSRFATRTQSASVVMATGHHLGFVHNMQIWRVNRMFFWGGGRNSSSTKRPCFFSSFVKTKEPCRDAMLIDHVPARWRRWSSIRHFRRTCCAIIFSRGVIKWRVSFNKISTSLLLFDAWGVGDDCPFCTRHFDWHTVRFEAFMAKFSNERVIVAFITLWATFRVNFL